MKKINKLITILALVSLLLIKMPIIALADDIIPTSSPTPTESPVETPAPTPTSTPEESPSASPDVNVNQNNSADVVNNIIQTSDTGNNSASENTDGNSNIETANANTSATVITSVNTNIQTVSVHEFNVNDNQTGDIVLNFDNPLSPNTDENTFQNNDASIGNTMTLVSNTGNNKADNNTNGDSNIITGDANINANVLTFANNNIDGSVVYGVVNIYGDLNGDIILPVASVSGTCKCSIDGVVSANNNAHIENNLDFNAITGENTADYNTDGNVNIETGNVNIDSNTLNIANTNIDGGWWLVLVNNTGQWIGKILGGNGTNIASSDVTNITPNSADSSGSQENNVSVVNNINLTANTGGNSTSYNTGGNSSIKTGNANIIANLVNFVNNNVSGSGKLVVTVVNVFGSWLGNFVTPGYVESNPIANEPTNPPSTTANTNNSSNSAPTPNPTGISLGSNLPQNKVKTLIASIQKNNETPKGQVLGDTTSSDTSSLTKAKKTINLAWLIIPAGLLLVLFIVKKLRKAI